MSKKDFIAETKEIDLRNRQKMSFIMQYWRVSNISFGSAQCLSFPRDPNATRSYLYGDEMMKNDISNLIDQEKSLQKALEKLCPQKKV
jgi:hypothetical protein